MEVGSYVWVKWSYWGKQAAQVLSGVRGERLTVRKYQARSKRWTGPIRIYAQDVIGPYAGPPLGGE